jgi:hypothetical protein
LEAVISACQEELDDVPSVILSEMRHSFQAFLYRLKLMVRIEKKKNFSIHLNQPLTNNNIKILNTNAACSLGKPSD